MLIPSIDLQDGAVVQLVQGERLAIKDDDVFRWVRRFEHFPKVQVIDLDAAMGSGDKERAALSYQALELFAIWPMFTVGAVCLVTGLLLGLGTKFGLVRYWWVATKLVLNLLLSTLVLVALRPGVHETADLARRLAAGEIASIPVGDMIFPPIVSPLALMVAVTLSVYKPWGRIRKEQAR